MNANGVFQSSTILWVKTVRNRYLFPPPPSVCHSIKKKKKKKKRPQQGTLFTVQWKCKKTESPLPILY